MQNSSDRWIEIGCFIFADCTIAQVGRLHRICLRKRWNRRASGGDREAELRAEQRTDESPMNIRMTNKKITLSLFLIVIIVEIEIGKKLQHPTFQDEKSKSTS